MLETVGRYPPRTSILCPHFPALARGESPDLQAILMPNQGSRCGISNHGPYFQACRELQTTAQIPGHLCASGFPELDWRATPRVAGLVPRVEDPSSHCPRSGSRHEVVTYFQFFCGEFRPAPWPCMTHKSKPLRACHKTCTCSCVGGSIASQYLLRAITSRCHRWACRLALAVG